MRSVETRKFVAERETAERLKEAREHAERFKSYEITPLDEARRRAKREDRERKYQDMGRAIRSANGRSDFSSGNWLDNNN